MTFSLRKKKKRGFGVFITQLVTDHCRLCWKNPSSGKLEVWGGWFHIQYINPPKIPKMTIMDNPPWMSRCMDPIENGDFPVSHFFLNSGVYIWAILFHRVPKRPPFQVASKLGNPRLFRYPTGTGLERNSFSKREKVPFFLVDWVFWQVGKKWSPTNPA